MRTKIGTPHEMKMKTADVVAGPEMRTTMMRSARRVGGRGPVMKTMRMRTIALAAVVFVMTMTKTMKRIVLAAAAARFAPETMMRTTSPSVAAYDVVVPGMTMKRTMIDRLAAAIVRTMTMTKIVLVPRVGARTQPLPPSRKAGTVPVRLRTPRRRSPISSS
jgi:hypothetical protein